MFARPGLKFQSPSQKINHELKPLRRHMPSGREGSPGRRRHKCCNKENQLISRNRMQNENADDQDDHVDS